MSDFLNSNDPATRQKQAPDAAPPRGDSGDPESRRDIGNRLGEAAHKGLEALRSGMEQVSHFAGEARKLGEYRIELHNLQSERTRLLKITGEKAWRAHQSDRVDQLATLLGDDFQRLDRLEQQIRETEEKIEQVSLRK